jgi:NADPH2:quinone reductase
MKAVVCREFGSPDLLRFDDMPSLRPGRGQVVVSVRAASLNFPDSLIIENRYQTKPQLPFVPGSELAGVVKEVGEDVAGIHAGQRVMCIVTHGAFAEECLVPAHRVIGLPEAMDFQTGAGFLLTYGTSHHALRNCIATSTGEVLLVLGAAGGVGLAAIDVGKHLGLEVIACASSPEKLAICREHGADHVIDYASEDLRDRVRALTGGRGADVVYDPVGGSYAERALRALGWRGRFLVVGFAAGEIPKFALNLALLSERSIVGVHWGAWVDQFPDAFAAQARELASWFASGVLHPRISAVFPMAEATAAMKLMKARKVIGKVVLAV